MKSNKIQLKLNGERKKIDKIDRNLMKFLDLRAERVLRIGKIKLQNNIPIQNLSREKQVLEKTNLFKNKSYLRNIFKIIIYESKLLQKDLR